MKMVFILSLVIVFLMTSVSSAQDSTKVVVRAIAKDAKFIGTSMGGALIVIKDTNTNKILAEGHTEGSTGNTDKLVREPNQRYESLSSEDAAKFVANLALSEPTFVTVSATGPMAQKQSHVTSSTQLWLIPGKDITGDGIILEIPGFAIDILQPQAHEVIDDNNITITANAVMMCGCPIEPGGLWNSDEMEFTAIIKRGDETVTQKSMTFAGKTSTFETSFTPKESGAYEIIVYGFDSRTGNTGVDKTTFVSGQ